MPANITIIYNGVPLGIDDISITKEDFVPATGSVVLYDSDGDNKYDFLYIYSYETYIVSTVDTDKEIIYLKEYKKPIELREYNADILDNQSNPVELANIKENNIISVLSSLSGDLLKVYVSDEMISDVVIAKDTDGTITTQNNGSFELADSYMKTGGLDKLEFTTLYKMCIDVFGDIAHAEHDNINLWNTAILINAANNSRSLLSENFEICLYTLEGKMIVLKPAKKVIILKSDNTKVRLEDEDAIEEIYNYAQANLTSGNRMIRYKLNMQGELCEIEFALSTDVELSEINESRLFVIHDASTTKTTFAGGTFVGKVIPNTGVKVVVMPDEITTNENDYSVTDISMFIKDKYAAPEWGLIQAKKQVYKDLSNINSNYQYQLASKISYQDAICGNGLDYKAMQPHQIPFRIERDKENFVDYYIAINKNFDVYYVDKQWLKNNIEDIANAKLQGARVVFSF